MDEYQMAYKILWAGCSEAMEQIEKQNFGSAREILIVAQQNAENAYIEEDTTRE